MPSLSIISSIVLGTTGIGFAIFAGVLQTFPCCGAYESCGFRSAAELVRDFGCDIATNQKFRCCLKTTLGWTFLGVALFFLTGACFFGVKQCMNRKKKAMEKERRRQERERRRFLQQWQKGGGGPPPRGRGSQPNIFYAQPGVRPQRTGSVELMRQPRPVSGPGPQHFQNIGPPGPNIAPPMPPQLLCPPPSAPPMHGPPNRAQTMPAQTMQAATAGRRSSTERRSYTFTGVHDRKKDEIHVVDVDP